MYARIIHTLASREHGVVTRADLLGAGVPAHIIDRRVRNGTLHTVYRGVYRIPSLATSHTRFMAAVLACGRGCSLLSHRSAAALWDLLACPERAPVDILVRQRGRGRLTGVKARHAAALGDDETTSLHGMPVTTPARTLLDVAGVVSRRELEQALAVALDRPCTTRQELDRLLVRHPRHPGSGVLRRLLRVARDLARTRSLAEEKLLRLVRDAEIPEPRLNVGVAGYEVDFCWPEQRLVVEVDGRAFHTGYREFQRDRTRGAALAAVGYRVMRVTWADISDHPARTISKLTAALLS
jgi:very-short-patch-repair endonuclease